MFNKSSYIMNISNKTYTIEKWFNIDNRIVNHYP
ncbi:tryptophanase leader peptide [Budviciaceae bacterium CWB-B4]|uniref:Tryptophanase leader peptide n=1 Tax=Limnobaculum xujianqingii TaxID=2738837 RepID=A0A9D7AIL3_9GAMM|nr:tryptophanase leader peptide [Limnobaculum xujianqingii]MBK5176656.1 tryptophanase leader peptide [Limnobaculum xujianqingii]